MSLEIGGRADKLGNEYERRWVVNVAFELLEGRATWIQWEPQSSTRNDFAPGRPAFLGHSDVAAPMAADILPSERPIQPLKTSAEVGSMTGTARLLQ